MCDLKNKTKKENKVKETHRYREQMGDCLKGGFGGVGKIDEVC